MIVKIVVFLKGHVGILGFISMNASDLFPRACPGTPGGLRARSARRDIHVFAMRMMLAKVN
jgi:hypothetical protein